MFDHMDAFASDDSTGLEIVCDEIDLGFIKGRFDGFEFCGDPTCVDRIADRKENVEEETE